MKFGGRKFTLALIAMLASVGGLFNGNITGNEWFLVIGVILGLYGAANVMQRKAEK